MRNNVSPDIMAAASPTLLAKGCVNVIGLDGIKNQAGARWPRICESVYARLDSLLRACLGPADFSARIDDAAYLVTMPTSESDDVNVVCLRAACNLHKYFLGQCDLGNIQIANVSCGPENSLVLTQLSPEQIAGLAKRAGVDDISMPDVMPKSTQPSSFGVLKDRTLNGFADVIRRTALPPIGPGLIVQIEFVPVWNASRNVLLTYICEPRSITFDGRRMSLMQLSPNERLEAEIFCFQEGLAQYAKFASMGIRFLLGIQISFEVLGSPKGRREILSICRSIPYEYRDLVAYVLTEIPPGVAQTRLSNMVTLLKPYGRRVSATIAPHVRVSTAYQGVGLHSVGFDLREFSPYDPFLEDDGKWLARTEKKFRVRSFLLSVRDTRTLELARDSGINYLCGPAVLRGCREPAGIRRCTWSDVMGQMVYAA